MVRVRQFVPSEDLVSKFRAHIIILIRIIVCCEIHTQYFLLDLKMCINNRVLGIMFRSGSN